MKKTIFIALMLSALIAVAFKVDFQRFNVGGCPFCKKEILESQAFYRGDKVLGVITHKPAARGHVLIIPERHVVRFEELTAEEMVGIQEAIKKINGAVSAAFGHKDYILIQKNGREAGQSVPHLHFHYLPGAKFLAVRFLISPWLKPLNTDEMEQLREILIQALKS